MPEVDALVEALMRFLKWQSLFIYRLVFIFAFNPLFLYGPILLNFVVHQDALTFA
jgi:hypothetical protein